MQLYSTTDEKFDEWITSDPTQEDLFEALMVIEAKRAALWTAGTEDSYHRDRYERDAKYVVRLRCLKNHLANMWLDSGEVV